MHINENFANQMQQIENYAVTGRYTTRTEDVIDTAKKVGSTALRVLDSAGKLAKPIAITYAATHIPECSNGPLSAVACMGVVTGLCYIPQTAVFALAWWGTAMTFCDAIVSNLPTP